MEIDLTREEMFEVLVMAEDKIHFEIEYLQRLSSKYSQAKSIYQELSKKRYLLHKIRCNISELMVSGGPLITENDEITFDEVKESLKWDQ